jgi:hypothetical protein
MARSKSPPGRSAPSPDPSLSPPLRRLVPLVGVWDVTLRWPEGPHKRVGGTREVEAAAEFSWLKDGGLLHYQIGPSHWFIGADEGTREYTVLYADERPVSRVYRMTFARGLWRIWRKAPGFAQRFEGRLRDSGRRIEAHWDRSEDGRTWVRDFEMVFTRARRRD